ncbi:MAG: PLP-dependent transferase, partial [Methanobacteriota archaeon]
NAEAIAKFLKSQKAVAKVHYPGLPDDPGHAIAKKQMRRFGGMLSFEVRDPSRVVERLKRLEVIVPAESLGGVESLIEHPASMTHASVPKDQREKQGITDGLVRFSIGLEDVQDLTEDLEQALG